MVPGPVTTLEALLGHITEHLLQLLRVAQHQRGRKEALRWRKVQGVPVGGWGGVLRNTSCLASRKVAAVQ